MQIIPSHYGYRVSAYALRWAHMIVKTAKDRARILAFWEKHGLEAAMEAFGAKRSTLYEWRKQLREGGGSLEALNPDSTAPKTKRSRKAEWPPPVLTEIRRLRETHPNLGPDKTHILLDKYCRKHQLDCPRSRTIARLIADMGGLRAFPQKVRHDGTIVKRKRGEVLRKPKGFKPDYPGHLISLDTIERFIHGSRRYILTATDGFSRFSFAWATTSHASAAAKEFFRIMLRVFPVPYAYVLTDNGSEFKKEFAKALRQEHLTHWKTYPHCPRMNGRTERFNRTLQEEFIDYHAGSLLNPDNFNRQMVEYLLWYNGERPHYALELKSPVQFLVDKHPQLSRMWWRNTMF